MCSLFYMNRKQSQGFSLDSYAVFYAHAYAQLFAHQKHIFKYPKKGFLHTLFPLTVRVNPVLW